MGFLATFLGFVAACAVIAYGGFMLLQLWAEQAYDDLKANTETNCDIDAFVGPQNPPDKLKVTMANKLRLGNRKASKTPIPLECTESSHVKGLYVSRAVENGATDAPTPLNELLPRLKGDGTIDPRDSKKTVIVATIRMGFGHHRLAYSACSWALKQGYTTIFHDLINIESEESKIIGSADSIYSKMSRLSSELGGPVEWLWGKVRRTPRRCIGRYYAILHCSNWSLHAIFSFALYRR